MNAVQLQEDTQKLLEIRSEIRGKFPHVNFPTPVREPLHYGRMTKTNIPEKYAVVDRETGTVFNIVSEQYKIVTHEEILFNTLQTLERHKNYGDPDVNISVFKDGARMNLEIIFPAVTYEIKTHDKINPRFILRNSYDSGWRLKTMFGAFRLICSNGMIVGKKLSETSNKHMTSLDTETIFKRLESSMTSFSGQLSLWSAWVDARIIADQYERVFKELPFSDSEKEKIEKKQITGSDTSIIDLIQKDSLTVWEMNNALTEFITHDIESENRRVEVEEKVGRVMYSHFSHYNVKQ